MRIGVYLNDFAPQQLEWLRGATAFAEEDALEIELVLMYDLYLEHIGAFSLDGLLVFGELERSHAIPKGLPIQSIGAQQIAQQDQAIGRVAADFSSITAINNSPCARAIPATRRGTPIFCGDSRSVSPIDRQSAQLAFWHQSN